MCVFDHACRPALASYPKPIDQSCLHLESETVSTDDVYGERQWIELDGIGVATGLILFCFGGTLLLDLSRRTHCYSTSHAPHSLLTLHTISLSHSRHHHHYTGHATFPELYNQMTAEERPHFDKSLSVGCAIAGAFYLLFGGFSYFYFGDCVADTVTLNLMAASPLLGSIATVAVLTNTFFTFPVFVTPVLRILENLVYSPSTMQALESGGPSDAESRWRERMTARLEFITAQLEQTTTVLKMLAQKQGVKLPEITLSKPMSLMSRTGSILGRAPSLNPAVIKEEPIEEGEGENGEEEDVTASPFIGLNAVTFALRLGLVVLAATLAVSVPNFGFLVAIMGAVTTMLVSFILPTTFFMVVHWEEMTKVQMIMCCGILVLGVVGMAIGLYNTLVVGV